MKLAPVVRALADRVAQTVVHTGQHYDTNLSAVLFRQLGLRDPDISLGIGSATRAEQLAHVMTALRPVLIDRQAELVIVYGDVTSTIAAALTAATLGITVAHVEAGLRSFDRTMPEELNRRVTDQIADVLFAPSLDAGDNLRREGIAPDAIHCVGNVMIDTLMRLLPEAERALAEGPLATSIGTPYALVTLHRPSNVDDPIVLHAIVRALADVARDLPVIFPVHPRTRARLASVPVERLDALGLSGPLGYLEFLALQKHATVVITDSGGVQEETTWLGVPCLTLRDRTERPVTVAAGTNTLVRDPGRLIGHVRAILEGHRKIGSIPPLWDGRSGERIAAVLCGEPAVAQAAPPSRTSG